MKTETFEFTGYNGTDLPAYLWLPVGEVKAVLQITHGMTEHMGRYEAFAEYLIGEQYLGIRIKKLPRRREVACELGNNMIQYIKENSPRRF